MITANTAFSKLQRQDKQRWVPLRGVGLPITDDLDEWKAASAGLVSNKPFTKLLWGLRANSALYISFADIPLSDLEVTLVGCGLYPSITIEAFGVMLDTLDLTRCKLDGLKVEVLCHGLQDAVSLRKLCLRGNPIGPQGGYAVFEALERAVLKSAPDSTRQFVESLNLDNCELTQGKPIGKNKLYQDVHEYDSSAMDALGWYLENNRCKLKRVNLSKNLLQTNDLAMPLVNALRFNTSLTSLSLRQTNIHPVHASEICRIAAWRPPPNVSGHVLSLQIFQRSTSFREACAKQQADKARAEALDAARRRVRERAVAEAERIAAGTAILAIEDDPQAIEDARLLASAHTDKFLQISNDMFEGVPETATVHPGEPDPAEAIAMVPDLPIPKGSALLLRNTPQISSHEHANASLPAAAEPSMASRTRSDTATSADSHPFTAQIVPWRSAGVRVVSSLSKIDFGGIKLSDARCPALAKYLHPPPRLESSLVRLNLRNAAITWRGLETLQGVLRISPLKRLGLSYNPLFAKGAVIIGDILRSATCNLEDLDVSHCQLAIGTPDNPLKPRAGRRTLGDAISGAGYDLSGLYAIADALRRNQVLMRLNLANNSIVPQTMATKQDNSAVGKLADAFRDNRTLVVLDLRGNQVVEKGKRLLRHGLAESPLAVPYARLTQQQLDSWMRRMLLQHVRRTRATTDARRKHANLDHLDEEAVPTIPLRQLTDGSAPAPVTHLHANTVAELRESAGGVVTTALERVLMREQEAQGNGEGDSTAVSLQEVLGAALDPAGASSARSRMSFAHSSVLGTHRSGGAKATLGNFADQAARDAATRNIRAGLEAGGYPEASLIRLRPRVLMLIFEFLGEIRTALC